VTPETRKANTEAILRKEGIPFLPSLPCVESEEDTRLRSPEEVGIRIACLFCVVGSAFHVGETVFKDYLREYGLCEHLTPDEASFLSCDDPDRKKVIHFTWRSEAMFVLMWTGSLVGVLPLPRKQTDTGDIVSRFPGVDQSPWPIIRGLRLRRKSEILDASDLIYRLHWAARQARLEGKPTPGGLNSDVVQEWHHAINWITCYDDQDWDEVATDT
jgi:hypothetical protein